MARLRCMDHTFVLPLSGVDALLPVSQRQLKLHLLNEAGQVVGEDDDSLVDKLQRTAEVTPHLLVLSLAKQCVQVLGAAQTAKERVRKIQDHIDVIITYGTSSWKEQNLCNLRFFETPSFTHNASVAKLAV